ncbi:MAG TPA: 5-formyltetrahydrofolate cyclo-ligase [Geminicoccus sp.]|uniref:5-formyltetrahydrofolate cyclo-ligase n=1 Tax=Geminicoccus sp. TaxID=2024832 RepID=UPI002D05D5AE|nr:5-formyltetrahydrofolate cyclo-ligase [Geminicoccus sp.]HWL67361.1 5-formyltetrahydrofolate cyclo-ligase [Geminicoccus sp.]
MAVAPSAPAEKALLRNQVLAARAALAVADAQAASRMAALHFLRAVELCPARAVALFWPLQDEIDTKPLLRALHELGVPTALPRITGRSEPLRFHCWYSGEPLVAGPFRVQEPPAGAPEILPAVILTPLLAFDARGYRLGWGGGFYDRTIAMLREAGHRPLCIGYAFACQEVDRVPTEPFDEPLDMVVTETGCRHIR